MKALGKTVMTYTGYTLEQLQEMDSPEVKALLKVTDVLVDGRYEEALRGPYPPLPGEREPAAHRYEQDPAGRKNRIV